MRQDMPAAILFACTMNAVRSPMAAALMRHLAGQGVHVESAGVRAGERDPFVDAVLAEAGLSLGDRHPRSLDQLEDDYFDLIVTLAPEAHHRALEMTRSMAIDVEYWPTADPTTAVGTREQILSAYRDVRERLARRITERFALAASPPPRE